MIQVLLQKLWLLGIAAFLILLGVGIIIYSRWYNKFVHSSRTNAQIGAIGSEIYMIKDIFNPNI